jgi:Mg/Co/Ni transporter MgtE
VLASEISTGHEIGLIVVAAVFIAFALGASFLVPRYKPDFPGPSGLSVFVIVSVVMFALMVAAVNFFG